MIIAMRNDQTGDQEALEISEWAFEQIKKALNK
jgi:hypothetical protein